MSLVLITDSGIQELGKVSDNLRTLLAALDAQDSQLQDVRRSMAWGANERLQMSVGSLGMLARAMAKMPGRKLLVWVGPGWPIFDTVNTCDTNSELHRIFAEAVTLSNEMTQARVTLYALDPMGIRDAGNIRTILRESYTKPLRSWCKALPVNLALQVLAVQSGGLVLNSSNDVAEEVNTCVQDGSAWYTITFAPGTSVKPDTWHPVEVKLDRPGLTVRTRPGYYAQPQRRGDRRRVQLQPECIFSAVNETAAPADASSAAGVSR
ncbi:MAG TPA: VWA domain-containing protein [Acidobacteriaceae bacterium]|nr:VWA domain-containing protein [Acidobacteriaceae bacterium]